jgi:transcriptional regulator with XRE-family HTH domain
MTNVGDRIRARRAALGSSQERVAIDAGLSVKTIGGIERGLNEPRPDTLARIAKALGVSVEDLCVDEGEEPRASA